MGSVVLAKLLKITQLFFELRQLRLIKIFGHELLEFQNTHMYISLQILVNSEYLFSYIDVSVTKVINVQ